MVIKGEVANMVLAGTTKTIDLSSLRIRKTRRVRNKEKMSNPNMIILLHVVNMAKITLMNV